MRKLYALVANRYDVYNRSWMAQMPGETRECFRQRVRAAYPIDDLEWHVDFIEGIEISE